MKKTLLGTLVIAGLGLATSAQAVPPPSPEAMWRLIQRQQKQIEALQRQLQAAEEKLEAAGEMLDELAGSTAPTPTGGREGLGEAHTPFEHGQAGRTHLGGYGELHYNHLEGDGGAGDRKEVDFHRAVLFLGHEFSDRLRFFSEIEYEHADTESHGAVELEQAYIEVDLSERLRARGGLFLVPVGFLNEVHEPPRFYGVERNPVETHILPTTWWVGGAMLTGEIAPGLRFDAALHEGMKTSAADAYRVRKGRQKTSQAVAKDPAFTGRLRWQAARGLELTAFWQYQGDVTQSSDPSAGSANLLGATGVYTSGPFTLKALYARWDLDGSGPAALGADVQSGWYLEPSWKVNDQVGLFARYNAWDNRAGSDTGAAARSGKSQWNAGINWWIHPDVVLKADLEFQDNDDGRDRNGFNLGIGYQF